MSPLHKFTQFITAGDALDGDGYDGAARLLRAGAHPLVRGWRFVNGAVIRGAARLPRAGAH